MMEGNWKHDLSLRVYCCRHVIRSGCLVSQCVRALESSFYGIDIFMYIYMLLQMTYKSQVEETIDKGQWLGDTLRLIEHFP